jgi:multimeric flavodoxin WrbA
MKNIIILNGAAKKNGNTSKLIKSFTEGAESSGNHVREFYLQNMNINGCMGCNKCKEAMNKDNPCIQKDDMQDIYMAFKESDVVVFASPLYYGTITGTLKTVTDRLYAQQSALDYDEFKRESVLILTAGGNDYSLATNWYNIYEKYLDWKNLGEVLGSNKIEVARELGESIK